MLASSLFSEPVPQCCCFIPAAGEKARLLTTMPVCLPQLVQYARHIGIKTINLVRRQEQLQQLKDLG